MHVVAALVLGASDCWPSDDHLQDRCARLGQPRARHMPCTCAYVELSEDLCRGRSWRDSRHQSLETGDRASQGWSRVCDLAALQRICTFLFYFKFDLNKFINLGTSDWCKCQNLSIQLEVGGVHQTYLEILPERCRQQEGYWRAEVPLICFQVPYFQFFLQILDMTTFIKKSTKFRLSSIITPDGSWDSLDWGRQLLPQSRSVRTFGDSFIWPETSLQAETGGTGTEHTSSWHPLSTHL